MYLCMMDREPRDRMHSLQLNHVLGDEGNQVP
jgi:hypothetical protein